MSMVGLGLASLRVLPNPDSTIAEEDRAQLLYLYAGITLGDGSSGTVATDGVLLLRRRWG